MNVLTDPDFVKWWNAQSEPMRAWWLGVSDSTDPTDAWAAYQRTVAEVTEAANACSECGGIGRVEVIRETELGDTHFLVDTCVRCDGTGREPDTEPAP
jgi:DnaJ-class molecular chaperone